MGHRGCTRHAHPAVATPAVLAVVRSGPMPPRSTPTPVPSSIFSRNHSFTPKHRLVGGRSAFLFTPPTIEQTVIQYKTLGVLSNDFFHQFTVRTRSLLNFVLTETRSATPPAWAMNYFSPRGRLDSRVAPAMLKVWLGHRRSFLTGGPCGKILCWASHGCSSGPG